MPGYLIDTNHVQAIFDEEAGVKARLTSLPQGTQLRACAITLGEIDARHAASKTTNQSRRDEYIAFIKSEFEPHSIAITASTAPYYARIVGEIRKRYPNKKTEPLLSELGVDINDVWIAAVALEHGLTLVTRDAMKCINEAVPELKPECWMLPDVTAALSPSGRSPTVSPPPLPRTEPSQPTLPVVAQAPPQPDSSSPPS